MSYLYSMCQGKNKKENRTSEYDKVAHGLDLISPDGCNCMQLLSKFGTGNCEDIWKDIETGNTRLWCYVEEDSNCTDKQKSEFHSGRFWSYLACQRRRELRGCCSNIML